MTYNYTTICQNCGASETLAIEQGTTTVAAVSVAVCTTCGCTVKQ